MSLINHVLWPEIAPFIRIEIYAPDGGHKNPRFRIEIDDPSDEQKSKWLSITVPCVACGEPIHPIRERKGHGSLYFAPCCPLNVNTACSRGRKAHDEYLKLRAALTLCQK